MAKPLTAPVFKEVHRSRDERYGWDYLEVEMQHPTTKHPVKVSLARHDQMPRDHWHVAMVGRPAKKGYIKQESRAINKYGPAVVRDLARHLRSTYAINSVSGYRVSGARSRNHQEVHVDLHKALNIRELHHTPGQILHLEFQHQDEPKRVNRIYLSRDPVRHPPGIWTIGDIVPKSDKPSYAQDDEETEYLKNQNKFGVKNIRQLASHLKEKYGIRAVKGTRVTGVRQEKSGEEAQTTVRFEKALRLTAHKPMPVQSGRYQQVKDDWHHEGTTENPLNQHKRVVEKKPAWTEGPSKIGTYRVSEDKSLLNHYFVNEVQAVTRGGGKAAMQHLTAAADRHGVSLSLVAEPLKPQGEGVKMTRSKLRAWYHQHGFRPSKGDLMTRTPARLEKALSDNDAPEQAGTSQDDHEHVYVSPPYSMSGVCKHCGVKKVFTKPGLKAKHSLHREAQESKKMDKAMKTPKAHLDWHKENDALLESKGFRAVQARIKAVPFPGSLEEHRASWQAFERFRERRDRGQMWRYANDQMAQYSETGDTHHLDNAEWEAHYATVARNRSIYKSNAALAGLYTRLEKSWFMNRRVTFGSYKRPTNEGPMTTTAMRDGTARKIVAGPVKTDRTPDAKKGKLRKEVSTAIPSDFTTDRRGDAMLSPSAEFNNQRLAGTVPGVSRSERRKMQPRDSATEKHTMMRDGSVARIRLFAKAFAELLDSYTLLD